ncbi:A disintegrin and metalloproteinase with thrombospondin motifs 10-like [Saccoglossus kowalevskii]|uniref:A disintegrin and metalloproteinase with thrombospondin motifs 17-like n=1 Tax=Saccoglossus kowalevskii TaxID=10224 RepID=A0ABM0H020_SACKO|nr:PREDICTED: A disintegrin and metalloproteinase with thrombospondin motifs 17-like [Saccoglossus kowalevskii]
MDLTRCLNCVVLVVIYCLLCLSKPSLAKSSVDVAGLQFHHNLKERDIQFYFGTRDLDEVPEYEIVKPERKKRNARQTTTTMHHKINAFGEDFLLDTRPNTKLLSPGFHIHYSAGNGSTWLETLPSNPCYYGHSQNHEDSKAYVGVFDDRLIGLIMYGNYTVYIQPVKSDHYDYIPNTESDNAHIIHRRSTAPSQAFPNLRTKRSSYGPHYVELQVVADSTMYSYHGDDTAQYILSMLNGVAALYDDDSLGVDITLYLTKLEIIAGQEPEVVADADTSLNRFRNYMIPKYISDESSPLHFDIAALITRVDLSYMGDYMATGLAYKYGACNPGAMYSISEDSGPMELVLTLAHEIGHNLGMRHDGDQNTCADRVNIMTGYPVGGVNSEKWSWCSDAAIKQFLDSNDSGCLNQLPSSGNILKIDYKNEPAPGLIYGTDQQCQMIYGNDALGCTDVQISGEEKCLKLRCFQASKSSFCLTNPQPPLDGTSCGSEKWCKKGICEYKPVLSEGETGLQDEDEEEWWMNEDSSLFSEWDEDDEYNPGQYPPETSTNNGYQQPTDYNPGAGYPQDQNSQENAGYPQYQYNPETGDNTGYPQDQNNPENFGYPQDQYNPETGDNTGYPQDQYNPETGENTGYPQDQNNPENFGYPQDQYNPETGDNTGYPQDQYNPETGDKTGYPPEEQLIPTEQPITTATYPAYQIGWIVGDYSNCSAECSGGNKTRTVTCAWYNSTYQKELDEIVCANVDKPTTRESCNNLPCFLNFDSLNTMFEDQTIKFGSIIFGLVLMVLASLLVFVGLYKKYKKSNPDKTFRYSQLSNRDTDI